MVVTHHLTETAQVLVKGYLLGDEDLTDCHRDHPHLPITTATESRFRMDIATETGTGGVEDPVEGVLLGVQPLPEEVILTLTSQATRESAWIGTKETAVE